MKYTAHLDTFARDHLPPPEAQPEFRFDLPGLQFPERLNCATELLDRHVREGRGERRCVDAPGGPTWTYAELQRQADAIAHVLVEDCGLVPGNRVLLRAANKPMLVACWFAVMKVGGIAVATMPMLRAKELGQVIEKARVTIALCDVALRGELDAAATAAATVPEGPAAATRLEHVIHFGDPSAADGLEARMARHVGQPFAGVDTAADDTCLLAFTSGTTGQPKATMHFHRDVMASCVCFPPHVLRAQPDDVFIGSPPLAFTFGLGGLTLFPMHIGASTVLLEKAGPPELLEAIAAHGATVCFTAPTSYRAMAAGAREKKVGARDGGSLRKCVAAGEALPAATRTLWKESTGIEIIDGIGATEMFHIFISADEANARPGATGKVVPGYRARVVDDAGRDVPAGTIGRLAVQGPTGCRYLDDPRQADYVKGGWNYTGDAYLQDADGYFFYQSRTDDMIISAGYNIAAIEVEDVLLRHEAVAECAVIGVADEERGQIVKAFVVLRSGRQGDEAMVKALQDFVKATVAPYKYPRAVEFREALPRTETGKLQRFRLRT
ncbi:MAG TPA: AMP-binding protein [Caldimonas sp.]|nr:AMP-binding protein [Caldimonas sp.]HEX2539541.1 AMP-binding protein [Caldimonas sp.]